MNTKNKTLLAVGTLMMATVLVAAFMQTNQDKENRAFLTNASIQTNEYGCAGNCTGEYYGSHVKELLVANPKLNGTENVRIIAKVSKFAHGYQWFQDIDDNTYYKSYTQVTPTAIHDALFAIDGATFGYDLNKFKQGDIVAFYGTINYVKGQYGAYTLEVFRPTFYKWNDKVDLSLLPAVVYLQ